MTQAAHFLSRLDRLNASHCELALSLYRDASLLRQILQASTIPDGCERVAISLAQGERGPFIVVDRRGSFITCLGEGMSPGTLPVVPHARLMAISEHVQELARRIRAAKSPGDGAISKLMKRVLTAGDSFSREEMYGLYGFRSMLGRQMVATTVDLLLRSMGAIYRMSRYPHYRGSDEAKVIAIWQILWAMNHSVLLFCSDQPEGMPGPWTGLEGRLLVSPVVTRLSHVSSALRGVWSLQADEQSLLLYESEYASTDEYSPFLDGLMGCLIIGIRNPSLRQRVREFLLLPPQHCSKPIWVQIHSEIKGVLGSVLREERDLSDKGLRFAQGAAKRWTDSARSGPRFDKAEDIPPALAYSILMHVPQPLPPDTDQLSEMLGLVPWLARARVEDLYLSADELRQWRGASTLDKAIELVRMTGKDLVDKPKRAPEQRPGPNERCPCGSGKKYKKCCGVVTAQKPIQRHQAPAYARLAGVCDEFVVEE